MREHRVSLRDEPQVIASTLISIFIRRKAARYDDDGDEAGIPANFRKTVRYNETNTLTEPSLSFEQANPGT